MMANLSRPQCFNLMANWHAGSDIKEFEYKLSFAFIVIMDILIKCRLLNLSDIVQSSMRQSPVIT